MTIWELGSGTPKSKTDKQINKQKPNQQHGGQRTAIKYHSLLFHFVWGGISLSLHKQPNWLLNVWICLVSASHLSTGAPWDCRCLCCYIWLVYDFWAPKLRLWSFYGKHFYLLSPWPCTVNTLLTTLAKDFCVFLNSLLLLLHLLIH